MSKKLFYACLSTFILLFLSACSTGLDGSGESNNSPDAEPDSLASSDSDISDEELGSLLDDEVVEKNMAESKPTSAAAAAPATKSAPASSEEEELMVIEDKAENVPALPALKEAEVVGQSGSSNNRGMAMMGAAGGAMAAAVAIDENRGFQIYKAEGGETLMWVGFRLYGDYRMWKKLVKWNGNKVMAGPLASGQEIKYIPSDFNWKPRGNPYLIQRGDYLAKISYKVYGTHKKWRAIWENNRPMIRYPDLIFAGFTLYYVPKEELLAATYQ